LIGITYPNLLDSIAFMIYNDNVIMITLSFTLLPGIVP
jgi:hypothetical protein